MTTITNHAEYIAAQRRLRSLRGQERAELAQEITAYKNAEARSRSVNGGHGLVQLGQREGCAELVRLGRANPHGLETRAAMRKGYRK